MNNTEILQLIEYKTRQIEALCNRGQIGDGYHTLLLKDEIKVLENKLK